MDTKSLGKLIYLGGLVTAVIVALINFSAGWLTMLLMIAGVLIGFLYADPDDIENLIIRYFGLSLVAESLDGFIAVGPYITTTMQAIVGFLGPVILTSMVVWFFNKAFKK